MKRGDIALISAAFAAYFGIIGISVDCKHIGSVSSKGYAPSREELQSLHSWSDFRLYQELYQIDMHPGIHFGEHNFTLPQREAYNLITTECSRRNRERSSLDGNLAKN